MERLDPAYVDKGRRRSYDLIIIEIDGPYIGQVVQYSKGW